MESSLTANTAPRTMPYRTVSYSTAVTRVVYGVVTAQQNSKSIQPKRGRVDCLVDAQYSLRDELCNLVYRNTTMKYTLLNVIVQTET